MARSSTSLLEETLEAWAYARQGVIAEVKNLPVGRFDFRPTPATRSVTELVQHIIESGLMMSGELTSPKADFTRQSFSQVHQAVRRPCASTPIEELAAPAAGRGPCEGRQTVPTGWRAAHAPAHLALRRREMDATELDAAWNRA